MRQVYISREVLSVACSTTTCDHMSSFVGTRSHLCSHTHQPEKKASEQAVNDHLTFIRDQLYFVILKSATTVAASASATMTASTAASTDSSSKSTKNATPGSKTNATAATSSVDVMGVLRVHLSLCSLLRRSKHGTDPSRASLLKESASQGLTLCNAYLESHADTVRSDENGLMCDLQ